MLRFFTIGFVAFVAAVVVAAAIGPWAWWVALALLVVMLAIGVYDPTQRHHSVLRNFSPTVQRSHAELYEWLTPPQLLAGAAGDVGRRLDRGDTGLL